MYTYIYIYTFMYFNKSVYMNSVHKSCSSKWHRHSAVFMCIHVCVNVCIYMYIHLCISKKKGTRAAPQSDMGPRLSRFSDDSGYHIITPPSLSSTSLHPSHPPLYVMATVSRIDKIIGLFCRISSFYRALLQKRPVIFKSLLIVATP